jgi:hypothetical protein
MRELTAGLQPVAGLQPAVQDAFANLIANLQIKRFA